MNSSYGFARSSCRAVRSLAGLVVVASLTAGVGCGDSMDQPKPPGLSPVVGAGGGGGAAVGVPGGGGTPSTLPNAGGVSAAGGTPSTSSTGGAPAGGAPAAGAPAGGAPAGGAPAGGAPNVGGSAGQPPPSGDLSVFKDPGKNPWQVVPEGEVAAKCKLDPSKLAGLTLGSGFAIIRYGQMCYRKPATDGATAMWSATKTLGATVTGIANYETRDIPRTGPKTGQLKDTDKATYWLDTVTYNREAYVAHVLSMEAHNASLAYGSKKHSYDTVGSVQINTLGTMISRAISQDSMRLGTTTASLAQKFLFDEIGMKDSAWPGTVFAYTWTATLGDMARLGNLLIHQGVWSGKRILGADWVYKQTHPAFEDGNTAYGYLTWLVAKEGQTSIGGGSFTGGAGATAGGLLADDCGPSALWQRYPHGALSEAKDCTYTMNSCTQKYDVGLWSAQGLGGQFIVGHPGLDMVIVAKDYSGGGGPTGLWKAIRPALVALDPTYKGDEAAFCKAYAAGDYAPDLPAPIVQPPDEPKM